MKMSNNQIARFANQIEEDLQLLREICGFSYQSREDIAIDECIQVLNELGDKK